MEYCINENWKEYYEELEPKKRRNLYDQIVAATEDDGANAFRRELFEIRHKAPQNAVREVDNGIWHMLMMPANLKLRYKLNPFTKKTILQALKDLGLENVKANDETCVSAAYWEIRNIAKRYFGLCGGPKYARKIFGMFESNEREKMIRTAEDVCAMAYVVPNYYKLEEEMRIFSDAVVDQFYDSYGEEGKEILLHCQNTAKKVY